MPINRYQIRNVYSLADPDVYKTADKDDPEALLEGVAMAGLVGVLRQLGDLAEFAAEIFHDLHEEVMATAARGHGLLVRVQQLELEIPSVERAFLSQTSHSAFFPNSGIDWHPNQQTTQNLITTGDLPRFVMDSYEECRGPPRLFLLDKFDVSGAGACLKRYTDPSIYKVEASSYDIGSAEIQWDKKTRKTKKKGSRWKRGEPLEVSQPSHVKLHQLFLEERVRTGATESARRVKLKKRPRKFPFDSESGKSYMNNFLNSPLNDNRVDEIPTPADTSNNESQLQIFEDNILSSTLCSPIQSTTPFVASSVNDKHMTMDDETITNCIQNGSDDVASVTDNYMDALATIDSEHETEAESGPKTTDHITYADANSDGNTSPVGIESPPPPFSCTRIPFRPRVPRKRRASIAENSQNMDLDITNDKCMDDLSKEPNVCLNHDEYFDSPKQSEESEHSDILQTAESLSSFSFIRNHNADVPNILDTNKVEYAKGNYSTDFVDSGCSSPYSQVNVEEPGDIDDIVAGETAYDSDRYSCLPEEELKEIEDGILHSTEARVFSYSSEDETGLNTPEIEPEPVASVVGCNDCGLPKEETDFEEREIESVNPHDVKINDGKVIKTFEDFKESEEKEGNGICSLKNHEDLKESGEKEGIGRFIVENRQDSTESEDKEGKGCFILENSEKEEGNGRVTLENREYSKNSIEKEGNGCFNRENRESEASEEEEGNGCFTVMEGEDSEESKEKGGNGCFTHPEDSEESEEEGHGRFTLENHEASKKSEETERNGCFTQHEDSEESEEANGRFTLENCEDPEKSEEKDGNGCFTNLEDSKESEEKERNGGFTPENGEDSEKSEEKEGNSSFTHRYDSENSEEKEEIGRFTPQNDEDSEKSEEKEGNGCFTRRYDSEESEEREGNDCITLESRQHSENSEHKEGNGCSSLENHEDSMESDEKEGSFTHQYDSSESEEKEANGRSTLENHEDSENSLEKEGNDCFTVKNCEDSVESEGKEGNDCFPLENLEDSNESEEKEVNDCFTLENSKNSKESEEKERNDCFTLENLIDSEESEERDRIDHLNFTLENHKDTKESEEEGSGSFTPKTHEDAKNSGEKEEVDQVLGISPDDLNHNVYSLPDTTCDEGGDDNPSLNSKIIEDQISYFLPKTDQNQKSILYDLGPQPIDISACDHPIVEDNIDQTPNDQIDICEAKFDHPESHQLLVDSLTCIDHETPPINAQLQEIGHDFGKVKQHSSPVYSAFSLLPQIPPVKPEEMPPLPPLPPMQWRMRKLENSLFTPTDGQHTRSSFPPFFPSTPIEAPEATTHSIVKDGDRQSGNPFPSFFPSTPIEAPEVVSHSIVEDGCQQSDNPSPPYFPSTPIEAPEVVTQPIVEDCGQKSDNPSPPFFPSTPTEVPKVDTHSIVEDGGQQSDNPSPPYFPCTPIEAPEVVTQPIVEDCGQQSDNPSPPFFPSTPTEVPEVDTHSIVEDGGQHNDNPFPSFLTSTPIEALEAITHSIVEDEGQQNVPPFLPFFPSTSIEAPEVVTHSIVADCGQQSDNPSPPFFQSTPIEASEVDSHSIVEDGDQQSDSPFTPFSPSTPIKAPEVVTHMIVEDEIKNMDTEIYDDDENLVPKAAVESIQTASEQEVFLPSSHPPDVKEMQNTIQPMKIRPRSPLMDAVVAHDKTKLRKVSGQSTTQMSKRDERDAILDQIRAKSFNLKPPVQTRPSIQGPKTNLRVAAILEKANAIRQAFAGSDDEDDDSDSWSDS